MTEKVSDVRNTITYMSSLFTLMEADRNQPFFTLIFYIKTPIAEKQPHNIILCQFGHKIWAPNS